MKPARSAGIPAAGKPVMKHRWGKARCAAGDRIRREKLSQPGKKHLSYGAPSGRRGFGPEEPKPPRGRCRPSVCRRRGGTWTNHLATDPCSSVLPEERRCSMGWVGAELYGEILPKKKKKKIHLPEGYGERREHIWSRNTRALSAPPCFPFKARILGQMDPGRT